MDRVTDTACLEALREPLYERGVSPWRMGLSDGIAEISMWSPQYGRMEKTNLAHGTSVFTERMFLEL